MGLLNGEKTPNDLIVERLNGWLNNPPDFYDVTAVYDNLANLKKKARLLRGDIKRIENEISKTVDKPRSNEAKLAKLEATEQIEEHLTIIEADIEYYEMKAKKLEYMRSMFASSTYALKARMDIT